MKHRPHQVSIQALVNYLSGWNASVFFFTFFTLNKWINSKAPIVVASIKESQKENINRKRHIVSTQLYITKYGQVLAICLPN